MIIKGITVRLPPILLALVVLFAAVCAMSYGAENNIMYIAIGVPLCTILIIFPLFAAYTNEKNALKQEPLLRANAKYEKARQVTPKMRGAAVIVEGKIVKVGGLMMGKPTYIIDDGSGQIAVKRFAHPEPLVGVGANVEVLGTVFAKMTNASSAYINAVTIKPISKARAEEKEEADETEKIHIKKYN
ncbi:MAG: hypothetical protein Q4Q53_00370 [Methanocorpusculum sp.]|nr:hypothetical protein [Methanocorpusculum sp.]